MPEQRLSINALLGKTRQLSRLASILGWRHIVCWSSRVLFGGDVNANFVHKFLIEDVSFLQFYGGNFKIQVFSASFISLSFPWQFRVRLFFSALLELRSSANARSFRLTWVTSYQSLLCVLFLIRALGPTATCTSRSAANEWRSAFWRIGSRWPTLWHIVMKHRITRSGKVLFLKMKYLLIHTWYSDILSTIWNGAKLTWHLSKSIICDSSWFLHSISYE